MSGKSAGFLKAATKLYPASQRHFELCRECGASEVFDYKSNTIANDIATAVGKDLFVGLYNAIGVPESFEVVLPIMEKLGGGIVANTKPPGKVPDNITARFVLGIGEFSFPVWKDFVTDALASGKLKCLPKPKAVGTGLGSLQHAMDIRNGTVSAEKIVVEL